MIARKLAVVALALAVAGAPASAQGFGVGTFDLGPTIGLGGINGASMSIGGRIEKGIKTLPSLSNGVLSISGFAQHYSFDCGVFDCGSITFFGATANYHFVMTNKKIDPFIGLGLGYDMWNEPDGVGNFDYGGVGFVGNLGIRYYVSPKLAAYADVGAGAATLNIGVMFKLK